jgi:hypothetical protein
VLIAPTGLRIVAAERELGLLVALDQLQDGADMARLAVGVGDVHLRPHAPRLRLHDVALDEAEDAAREARGAGAPCPPA